MGLLKGILCAYCLDNRGICGTIVSFALVLGLWTECYMGLVRIMEGIVIGNVMWFCNYNQIKYKL